MITQIVIIGGGPSGLLLSQLLSNVNIDCIVLEKHSKEHVLSRIRAGVLEEGTISLLKQAGISKRVNTEGFVHDGIYLSSKNRGFRIDFKHLIDKKVTVYGQTELTKDLYSIRKRNNGKVFNSVEDVNPHNFLNGKPLVTCKINGLERKIHADFIVGCDGFHGISRQRIPKEKIKIFERTYPFGWLGILSKTPPVSNELIYANHETGFALASMRNENLSRYYIQSSIDEKISEWDDYRFWNELKKRLPEDAVDKLITGPSIEKSIAPLRSFVVEPMSFGKLFLVGDAAHIVPPTGAKGLNLAFSDVHYLYETLMEYYLEKNEKILLKYSEKALKRVWKAIRFSWWMTVTFHKFPNQSSFDQKMQESEIEYLQNSKIAQKSLAENYVGLPF